MFASRFTLIKMLSLFTLLIMSFTVISAQSVEESSFTFNSITFDDLERTFYTYVPADHDESTSVPLLIALSNRGANGYAMAIQSGFNDIADEMGLIVAYPNTYEGVWGEGRNDEEDPDDVGYVSALIDHLAETYNIDDEQIYLSGFANGGLMAYRLACELPERFKSVAIVGSLMWEQHQANCNDAAPEPNDTVSMLIVHGSDSFFYYNETHVYATLFGDEQYTILGREDTLKVWADRNGCDESNVIREGNTVLYDDCTDDARVGLYSIKGASLNWTRIGDYALNQFGVDTTEVITKFFFSEDDAWAEPQEEVEETLARTYTFYIPSSYTPDVPMPVMVSLHGRYGSGSGTAVYTGMNDIAEENGFIAVHPDGLLNSAATYPYDTGWNYNRGSAYFTSGDYDDVIFIGNLLDDLSQDINIDESRVYVNGLSNGGFMVQRLACDDPERFAAFASVAGSGYHDMPAHCDHDVEVPMLIIHGTYDDNVPWNGMSDMALNGVTVYSAAPIPELTNFWVFHNGCEDDYTGVDLPQQGNSPETYVRVFTVENCPVELYAIVYGGHNWPGLPSYNPDITGDVNMDINAGEVIWEFASRYSR